MYELITSKSNEKIKTVRKLADKKYRALYGEFTVEGHKLISDYVRAGGTPTRIFIADDVVEKYGHILAEAKAAEVYVVPRALYLHISEESAPQGIMAVCPITRLGELKNGCCVVLESLRDAGNLGTVIRTAVAFGIENIILSADCADLYNSKTLRATMGALFFGNVLIADDIVKQVEELKASGRRVFAAMPAGDALDVRTLQLTDGDCMVIGNEGNGISKELAECCTAKVTIPMRGQTESLNASSAASVLMWELVRGGSVK